MEAEQQLRDEELEKEEEEFLKGQQPKHQSKESRRVAPRVEQQGCPCGNPACRNGMVAYRKNGSEKGWHGTHRAHAPSLVDMASDSEEDRVEAAWQGDHSFALEGTNFIEPT